MSRIVVIDTETTWTDEVMYIGAVMADSATYRILDSRYYLIEPACRFGGMYSGALHMRGTPREVRSGRREIIEELRRWLAENAVTRIFAYNALFDQKHLPELQDYHWFDMTLNSVKNIKNKLK